MMLGAGGASKKYVDEVYSNYIWTGTGSSNTITNGIDLDGQGGMVWVKNRDQNDNHWLFANSLGIGNGMRTNSDADKFGLGNAGMSSFNSNGFTVGTHGGVNGSGEDIVSWTFRNSKAFQCLTYVGNATNRTISHSLGSVPGMVIVKKTDGSDPWYVWHRDLSDDTKAVVLNSTGGEGGNHAIFNATRPTATEFSLGTSGHSNENNKSYIAYLFAGGESEAATAVSVDFDGNDWLSLASDSDLAPGTDDFTFEAWIYPTAAWSTSIFQGIYVNYQSGVNGGLWIGNNPNSSGNFVVRGGGVTDYIQASYPPIKQWTHIAVTRSGSTLRLFYNGELQKSVSNSINFPTAITSLGSDGSGSNFTGKISNLRFVKGTAVYTTAFTPPTEPLTNITNTQLLCCNNSSTTGSTVTTGTITSNGDPTADTQSPFDDPDGFKFGEDEDKNVFKMGIYQGNGAATGPDVYVGWEPQYVLIKRIDDSEMWMIFDVMRGIREGQTDKELYAQSSSLEYNYDRLELTSTGFRPMVDNDKTNNSSGTYIYFCVRRADGAVGKPVETGSAVFSMNSGSASGAPLFDSTHVVDYQFVRNINSTWNWETGARLIGSHQVYLNTSGAETEIDDAGWRYDYMNGWHTNASGISNYMCWMFRRHAGFDLVKYTGDQIIGKGVRHNMNVPPEMMWIKRTDSSAAWLVYHTGLNGGSGNTYEYGINLTDSAEWQEGSSGEAWGGADPTSTHFTVGELSTNNTSGAKYLALLFSSVSGVSKVGVYAGSNSAQSITTGFQPRFVIIKNTANTDDWYVLDTSRGWASGDDKRIYLNQDNAQSDQDVGVPTSTGFDLNANVRAFNQAGRYYIYYAHA